jgi:hypothetical protein
MSIKLIRVKAWLNTMKEMTLLAKLLKISSKLTAHLFINTSQLEALPSLKRIVSS